MGIRARLNRIQPPGDCKTCGYPLFKGKSFEVEIRMHVVRVDPEGRPIYDPETGHVLYDPPIPPPRYCSECGRELEPIQMKGMQDVDVRGWGVPATEATGD